MTTSDNIPQEVVKKLEEIKSVRNNFAAVFTALVHMEYEDGVWFVDDTKSTQDINTVISNFVKTNSVKITSISAPAVTLIQSGDDFYTYSLSVSILYSKMPIDSKTITIPNGQQRKTIETLFGAKQ